MSLSIAGALALAREMLAGGESPVTDAKVLLAHVLGQSQTYLFTWSDKTLSETQQEQFLQLVSQRKNGHPVAHLTGYRDFWTLRLQVNPSTLIPRPETELLVEKALELLPETAESLCDLGTGTGAVALAIASERPGLDVYGVDRIADAVTLAKTNALHNDVANAQFLESHWFSSLTGKQFDMLVTNPPYVEASSEFLKLGDVRFEPRSALTAGEDGLDDIRFIITQARDYLKPSGWLLIEHGFEQGPAICHLYKQAGYTDAETFRDLAGHDRITVARMPACD